MLKGDGIVLSMFHYLEYHELFIRWCCLSSDATLDLSCVGCGGCAVVEGLMRPDSVVYPPVMMDFRGQVPSSVMALR
jgi:hypothetical protein